MALPRLRERGLHRVDGGWFPQARPRRGLTPGGCTQTHGAHAPLHTREYSEHITLGTRRPVWSTCLGPHPCTVTPALFVGWGPTRCWGHRVRAQAIQDGGAVPDPGRVPSLTFSEPRAHSGHWGRLSNWQGGPQLGPAELRTSWHGDRSQCRGLSRYGGWSWTSHLLTPSHVQGPCSAPTPIIAHLGVRGTEFTPGCVSGTFA